MSIIESLVLGITQGLSEFLPISSSGHLLIVSNVLGITEPDLTFDILVHLATLLAVLVYFFKDIINITGAFFKSFNKLTRPGSMDDEARFSWLIIISTIPTALVGFMFKDFFEAVFSSGWHVGMFLIVTGFILLFADKYSNSNKSAADMSVFDAVLIGIAQSFAIFPGVSRSGSTVAMALFRKIEPRDAAKFSFFLSIPTILGAAILDIDAVSIAAFDIPNIVGMLGAFLSGLVAIKVLIKILAERKLKYFYYYCFVVGISLVIKFI